MYWNKIEYYMNLLHKKTLKKKLSQKKYKKHTMQLILWDMNNNEKTGWEVDEDDEY